MQGEETCRECRRVRNSISKITICRRTMPMANDELTKEKLVKPISVQMLGGFVHLRTGGLQ